MMNKKYLIIFAISAGIIFGIFALAPAPKTFYIKNDAPYLPSAALTRPVYPADEKIGNLNIPSIKVPENITENLAKILGQEIINKNDGPQAGLYLPGPGVNVPDPDAIAAQFIKDGLKKANGNILDIAPINLKTSPDNSESAITSYIVATQKIINDGLEPKGSNLIAVLEEINANSGAGSEKLILIASSYEAGANEIEKNTVPSTMKNLMAEDIRLLRITANVLKAIVKVESDPLATIAAIGQFDALIKSWIDLQGKFDAFTNKLNGVK